MTRVEIDLTAADTATIKLDGVDVAREVRSLTLNANVGEVPTVILRIGGKAWAAAEAGVRVVVSGTLRAALVAGGWTPPGEVATNSRPNMSDEIVHGISDGSVATWCCRRTPFELPAASHRLTQNAGQVTCPGRPDSAPNSSAVDRD